jgi:flagellar protein FlaG
LSGASGGVRHTPTDLGQAGAGQTSPTEGTGNVAKGPAAGNAGVDAGVNARADATVASTGTSSGTTRGAEELKKLVAEMQTQLFRTNTNLMFSVDQDSGRSMVKVTERTTNEVIWQFPSEEALQVSKELGRYLGSLVNRTA